MEDRIDFGNGVEYVGEVLNNKPHGKGKLSHTHGTYEGDFVEGYFHGHGVVTINGILTMEADFEMGITKGIVDIDYVNGNHYHGECENNTPHGRGTMNYGKDKYTGEYMNGIRHGKGSYEFEDGSLYVGEFENDTMSGRGIFNESNGNKYDGEFKDGTFDGKGIYYFFNGDRYEGEFQKGVFHGKGVYYKNGTMYEGFYQNGELKVLK